MLDINEVCYIIAVTTQLGLLIYVVVRGLVFNSFEFPNWMAQMIGAATGSLLSALAILATMHYKEKRDQERELRKLLAGLKSELFINYQNAVDNSESSYDNFHVVKLRDYFINSLLAWSVRPAEWNDADLETFRYIARLIDETNLEVSFAQRKLSNDIAYIADRNRRVITEIKSLNSLNLEGLGNFLATHSEGKKDDETTRLMKKELLREHENRRSH
jgi:hypothetical protein